MAKGLARYVKAPCRKTGPLFTRLRRTRFDSLRGPRGCARARSRVLALLAAALTGCGPCACDNHGYGYQYDFRSSDGVRFRNGGRIVLNAEEVFQQFIVEPYRQTEACTGISAGGPLVVGAELEPPKAGTTYFDTGLILITLPLVYLPPDAPSGLRHEYVHYLLWTSGFPDEANAAHQSPLFIQCAGM